MNLLYNLLYNHGGLLYAVSTSVGDISCNVLRNRRLQRDNRRTKRGMRGYKFPPRFWARLAANDCRARGCSDRPAIESAEKVLYSRGWELLTLVAAMSSRECDGSKFGWRRECDMRGPRV